MYFLPHTMYWKVCLFVVMIAQLSLWADDDSSAWLARIPPSNLVACVVGYETRSTVGTNIIVPQFSNKIGMGADEKGALFYVLYPTNYCGNYFWIDNDFVPDRDGFGKPSSISDWYEQGKLYRFFVSTNSLGTIQSDQSLRNIINIHSFFRMDRPIHMYVEMQGVPDVLFRSRSEANKFIIETDAEILRLKGALLECRKNMDARCKENESMGQFSSERQEYFVLLKKRDSLVEKLNKLVGKKHKAEEQLSTIWHDTIDQSDP
jgi:hypothetical protein